MNKDIQTLIEREAENYSDYNVLFPKAPVDYSKKYGIKSFQAGASFALSLFKWRKVSEGLPEEDESLLIETTKKSYKGKMEKIGVIKTKEVLVKYANGEVILSQRCQCKGDNYFWWNSRESFDINDPYFVTGWMPIPNND